MRYRRARWMIAAVLLLGLVAPHMVRAQLDECNIDVSPHSVAPGSDNAFSFGVFNSNADPISWIKITRPAGSYVALESASASGWNGTIINPDEAVFDGGSLPNGYSQGFSVQALAAGANGGPVSWSVQMSDSPDGSNAITCSGDMSLVIETQPSIINISDVAVSAVGVDRVTVTWNTDVASTGQVDYGVDSNYGSSSPLKPNLVTNHSVTLTGLAASTGYHFMVRSTTPADGGAATSGDNTFLTADRTAISESGGVPGTSTGTIGGGPVTTPTGKPTEGIPPAITMAGDFTKPLKTSPRITGTASDNDAVAKVEYSIDGGKNWVKVDVITPTTVTTGKGKKAKTTTSSANVTYGFTPIIVEDGNYIIRARATDPSGNQTMSATQTLIIDRLPPRLGAALVAIGGQLVQPDNAGRWQTVVKVDQSLVINAVGGPVRLAVAATRDKTARVAQSFTLRQDTGSGLWRGTMGFLSPGLYHLSAEAIDGAGNQTKTALPDTLVLPTARLQSRASGAGITGGKVTVHYLQPRSNQWVVWDAASYGQQNPQVSAGDGAFSMLLPGGTYYVRAEAPGYKTVVTRQFKLDRPTPLATAISLAPTPQINLGFWKFYLPWVSLERITLQANQVGQAGPASTLIGRTMPDFSLPNTAGGTVSAVGLLGKPTIISVVSTWDPSSSEQEPILDKLSANSDLNVVPLVAGERLGRVQAYFARGGYTQSAVVDADATLGAKLGVPTLPTHYILDRRGRVKAILTGVKTADQLLDAVSSK